MYSEDLTRYREKNWKAQVIAVSGGKGGTGKTFFSVNFAVELVSLGFKVLIFDADINLSNVNLLMHIDGNKSFKDFLQKNILIESVIQKGVGGVDVLYTGDDIQKVFDIQDDEFKTIIDGLANIESLYDFIIIDTGAGLNEQNLRFMLNSDRIILIANPDITSIIDIYKVIKASASRSRGLNFEIVVNKSSGGEGALQIFEKIAGTIAQFNLNTAVTFLGYIFDDARRVLESIQKRTPIVILHNMGNIKQCFDIIANSFLKKARLKKRIPFIHKLIGR